MRCALAVLILLPCSAQHLLVYSPLTRIGPGGEIVKPDRGTAQPRHILSPGFPRNAYSSLRVVVELEKPESFILDIGQNPENAVKATLYRESFAETGEGLIPDALTKVGIPYKGTAGDFGLKGQKVVTFWLDMWVEANADVDRIKVEPQLWVESLQDWMVYPMEVRIQQPVVPLVSGAKALPALPRASAPSDAIAISMTRGLLCSAPAPAAKDEAPNQVTARHLLRRNIAQHHLLAKPGAALTAAFVKSTGVPEVQAWCGKPVTPRTGPEWYLRFRDAIYKAAGATD
jgi:hypothetical protein